jgi:hypothetical protein
MLKPKLDRRGLILGQKKQPTPTLRPHGSYHATGGWHLAIANMNP